MLNLHRVIEMGRSSAITGRMATLGPIGCKRDEENEIIIIIILIQYSHGHTFVQQQALWAEPCVRNCSSGEREGLYYLHVQQ